MKLLITFVICLLMASCSAVLKDSASVIMDDDTSLIVEDNTLRNISPDSAPAVGIFKGQVYSLHYNKRGELVFSFSGQPQIISQESPEAAALSFIVTFSDENGIYTFWRPKLLRKVDDVGKSGDKFIYFRATYDGKTFGETQSLSQGGGAFLPAVIGNHSGDLYTAWIDERGKPRSIYMNVSHNSGKTWKNKDFFVDIEDKEASNSLEPTLAAEGNNVWCAWGKSLEGKSRIYINYSLDKGETWRKPVIAYEGNDQILGLTMIRKDNHLILYWADSFALRLAYSADNGLSWNTQQVKGVENPSEMKVISAADGIHLFAGVTPLDQKQDLFVLNSKDGIHFSDPARIDTNLPHFTTSAGIDVAADGTGRILAAWNDHRNLRSNIYFNYSADSGMTWMKNDLPLSGENIRHAFFPRLVAKGTDNFSVIWTGYSDDRLEQGKVYLSQIQPEKDLNRFKERPMGSEKRLRERVSQFWNDRINANWGGNFDLMDPYLKLLSTREYYIANQFKTIYYDFEILDVTIFDNTASVKIKYTSEVPEFTAQSGKKLRVPKNTVDFSEDWVWIDRDWFRAYKDIQGGSLIKR